MGLILVATPIGNAEDITLRALKLLQDSQTLIAEETKILRRRLSAWDINPREKKIFELNEHTSGEDLEELFELCQVEDVPLVTDCGTPSFFDPGFKLVELCRKNHVPVSSFPGVSSMTALFPFLTEKTESFNVLGFPPRDNEDRRRFFKDLFKDYKPCLILDTPYRLIKTFEELSVHQPKASCTVGINLTCTDELIAYGTPKEILKQISHLKKENFVCMISPS
jgi:16S rRNA (cytidine1402-2'-O)-methyltransferase